MQSLLELAPLVAFFVVYKMTDIYIATAVLMGSMAVLLAVDYLRTRRIPPMHGLSALLVFIFGAATLILHDERFIKLKPTIFFWLVAAAFLGSIWIGKRPLVQRFFGLAMGDDPRISATQWLRINWLWITFYAALGALNLFAAAHLSTDSWVNFKIGLTVATAVFIVAQVLWLLRRYPPPTQT